MTEPSNAPVVVVGALAYDQISSTQGRFTHQQAPLLNCKLDDLSETFGGCGGNIAYNLAHLKCNVALVSATGTADDDRYMGHLRKIGVNLEGCLRQQDAFSARALIITDQDGHQFTGFFPGPKIEQQAWREHLQSLSIEECGVFVQAPYVPELMLTGLQHFSATRPQALRICCPGQYADQLSPQQAADIIQHTDWLVGNAYELDYLSPYLQESSPVVIRTNGQEAIHIYPRDGWCADEHIKVAVPNAPTITDPTGCGDAFLSGLVNEIAGHTPNNAEKNLAHAAAQGIKTAQRCIQHLGGQQHFNDPQTGT